MPSCTNCRPFEGVPGVDDGIMRLLVLTDGVMAAGVFREELVPERALSLLRERLDDEGEGGICGEAMVSGSLLVRTPVNFALRLRARSLCSLKKLLLVVGKDSGDGSGGTTKLGDGMMDNGRLVAGCGVHEVEVDRFDCGYAPGSCKTSCAASCDSQTQ